MSPCSLERVRRGEAGAGVRKPAFAELTKVCSAKSSCSPMTWAARPPPFQVMRERPTVGSSSSSNTGTNGRSRQQRRFSVVPSTFTLPSGVWSLVAHLPAGHHQASCAVVPGCPRQGKARPFVKHSDFIPVLQDRHSCAPQCFSALSRLPPGSAVMCSVTAVGKLCHRASLEERA